MLVSSNHSLKQLDQSMPISNAGTDIALNSSVKILGVTLDSLMTFDSHVTSVCQSCNFHSRAFYSPMLSAEVANQLACSIVATRLDYCNSLLCNTSAHNINRLQRIQNNLARIVCQAPARAHAAPLLKKLHWLPIEQRITYKIATVTYNALTHSSPTYLRNIIIPHLPSRSLRSSQAQLLVIPQTIHSLAVLEKSFSISAPRIWNSLSPAVRSSVLLSSFKRSLKTELFKIAFHDLLL